MTDKWFQDEECHRSAMPNTPTSDVLELRLRGRAAFCRDRAEIKTPELLEEAAATIERLSAELAAAKSRIAELESDG